MKKKVTSFVLAVLLLCINVIPAGAATNTNNWNYDGFYYSTTDTCNNFNYHCVIESGSADYTLRTRVDVYQDNGLDVECRFKNYGYGHYNISTTSGATDWYIHHITCIYYIGGVKDKQFVTNAC